MKIAVMGAAGYSGQVLMRLLLDHPEVHSILPVSSSVPNTSISSRDPGLGPDTQGKLPDGGIYLSREAALAEAPQAVFSALPPNVSAKFCEPFFGKSVIFDLSADFRLKSLVNHQQAYGQDAPFPEWRKKSVYGLTEIYRDQIAMADIVAVPGCYPTSVLLPLIPIAKAGMIAGPIIVNALSGISGAGRKAKESSLYVKRSESAAAYNPGRLHRHVPEMCEHIEHAGSDSPLFFTPHLVPMRRGMTTTTLVKIIDGVRDYENRIAGIMNAAFVDCPFIRLRAGEIPDSSDVLGSNRCDIAWRLVESPDGKGVMLYLFSVIDNLLKGAAGQAVQNFNLRFAFSETCALPLRSSV